MIAVMTAEDLKALRSVRSIVPEVEVLARELTASRGYIWEALSDTGRDHWMDEARRVLALPSIRSAFLAQEQS